MYNIGCRFLFFFTTILLVFFRLRLSLSRTRSVSLSRARPTARPVGELSRVSIITTWTDDCYACMIKLISGTVITRWATIPSAV